MFKLFLLAGSALPENRNKIPYLKKYIVIFKFQWYNNIATNYL